MINQNNVLDTFYRVTLKHTKRAYTNFFKLIDEDIEIENESVGTFQGQQVYLIDIKAHPIDLCNFENSQSVLNIEMIDGGF